MVFLFTLLFFACKNFLVKPFYDRLGNGAGEPALAGKVIISGLPLAGSVLSADTSALNAPGPFNFQWRLDGVNIPGATGPDYTIDSSDLHKVLTVIVSCDGYSGFVISTHFTVTGSLILLSRNGGVDESYNILKDALDSITSPQTCVIKIGADQSLAQYPLNYGNVTLISQNNPITIQLSSSGSLFTITGATLTLDNGINIKGLNQAQGGSSTPMINVGTNGAFFMKAGSLLTGNAANNSGGAVYVNGNNANFTMLGGTISGNSTNALGGAVYVDAYASFGMEGGVISGNRSVGNGGGVYVADYGTFTKIGGTLYGVNGGVNANTTSSGEGHAAYHASSPDDKIRTNTAGPSVNMDSAVPGTAGGWDTGAVYVVEGSTLTTFANLQSAIASLTPGRTYTIIIGKNQTITPGTVLPYSGSFTLRADNQLSPVEVKISANGTMFSLYAGMMLTLENGVILKGRNLTDDGANNDSSLISLTGGTLNMKAGSGITGNKTDGSISGGAVFVGAGGTFSMDSGNITYNSATSGGGVFVGPNGKFTMLGGTISNNYAPEGGGIYASGSTSFSLRGGYVSDNEASSGGGIYIDNSTDLSMDGGTISANTANNGGGVYVYNGGTLFMSGGLISRNKANNDGGGVYISSSGIIIKSAGTIYGSNDPSESNLADYDNSGTGVGHAAYQDGITPDTRTYTAGPEIPLVSGSVGWD